MASAGGQNFHLFATLCTTQRIPTPREQEAELQALQKLAEQQLAERIRRARKAKRFSRERRAELEELQQAHLHRRAGELMQQVRDPGRYLKKSRGDCVEHWRWSWRGRLQELMDEISQLGHVPTQAHTASAEEKSLYKRLWRARKAGSLTRDQEAALEKLAQASVTKVGRDACAQGGDAGTGIRRRPAARNAEEDRRVSRRTVAA